ncbi:unnamed protein product [Lactuca virosa]|uniref:Uncharacterized protein n=1 Tax=Lactuca virosa TaxID=75947 RepID=A0AAU9PPR4_9ASTR|nr:unnamed protein product [Lactuca virosa]
MIQESHLPSPTFSSPTFSFCRRWIQSQRRPPSISDTIQHPPSFLLTATAPPNSACAVNNHWSTSFTHVIVENRFDIQSI